MKKFIFLGTALCIISFGQCEAVSLSLSESVRMALETHESIESAKESREAAKWKLSAARRSTGPTFLWQGQAVRIGGRDYATYRKYHRYSWHPSYASYTDPYEQTFTNQLSLTYPLYSGGRNENNIEASSYGLNAADLNVENARQNIRFQALKAYYNLLQQKNVRDVSNSAVEMASKQLNLIQTQFEEGAVAMSDVLQMKVQLANYQQNLVTAMGSFQVAQYTLARMVGLPQDTTVEPTDTFTYHPFPYTLSECEEYALEHRPDGAAAQYQVKEADAQKEAAKAGWRPTINGIVNGNYSGNQPFSNKRNDSWSAGLQFNWNVFDNAVTAANVNAAKASRNSAQAARENTIKEIQLETSSAYAQMKAAEENIHSTEVAVQQAENSYQIAQIRYEEGVDILLTVTNAQDKLTQARSNYYTALYNYNLYRAMLEKAMGIPVNLDVPRYVSAVSEGKTSKKALDASTVAEDTVLEQEPSK